MAVSSFYDVTSPVLEVPLRNGTGDIEFEDLSMIVFVMTFAASVISIILAIVFVIAFLKYQEKSTQNILIVCLTVANGLTCVGVVLGAFHYKKDIPFGNSGNFCIIQSMICTYFDIVADIYTLYVEINICLIIAFEYVFMNTRRAKVLFHGSACVIPLTIVLVAWRRDALGESRSLYGSWCWINESIPNRERWIWMVVSKQGWELVVYLGTCFMFIIIMYQRCCRKKQLSRRSSDIITSQDFSSSVNVSNERTRLIVSGISSANTRHQASSVNSILVWVGIYFYLAKMWGTIRYSVHIYALASDGDISGFDHFEKYFLIFVQSLGDSLQATITCCVFVLKDTELRRKMFCRSKKQSETNNHQRTKQTT
ncbi:G-protein coupled receptor 157-like [Pecten maximus]|uniref:G-protein coupled receptor 157-like n=1 Tax=Pecten maximus TaxID=6579 RepID=UPI0014584BD0|nr:G-protein coupled receptor 157-like [Pecten maximus]